MIDFSKYGIDTKGIRDSGKTLCPKCSHERKNKTDKCLSVNVIDGLFNCHNCGFAGCAKVFDKPKKEYTKPVPRLTKISDDYIKWFEDKRGITNNTLLRFGITESTEWMAKAQKEIRVLCFNYIKDGELVNIKFRGANKDFKLSKDSELVFYNLDAIKGETEAVICEGEIDCMALYDAGIYNAVSVPNGASKGNQRLEYLDNCWEYFEGKEKIYLFTDGDEAGMSLRDELARRLGKERCYKVSYPEGCKDSNEVLLKYGKEGLLRIKENATQWPVEGVVLMDEMFDTVLDYYKNGYPVGDKCGIVGFDDLLSFSAGQLTVVTGIPGSGKDEFFNWVMACLAKNCGWKFGIWNFEEPKEVHVTKLIEKFTDKAFAFRSNREHRINDAEFDYGIAMVDRHFVHVDTDTVDVTMTPICDKIKELVKRYGINGVMINPWNWLEHKRRNGITETEYVSEALSELLLTLKRTGVHCFLIAHPTKIQKDDKTGKYKVPTLYNINGSANFFNKTHNGVTVYRDFSPGGLVTVYVQKVKQSWDGHIGMASFNFNKDTRAYSYQV